MCFKIDFRKEKNKYSSFALVLGALFWGNPYEVAQGHMAPDQKVKRS